MDKNRAKQVISAEVTACKNTNDVIELVYELVVTKNIDKKSIRNKIIKAEFNELYKTNMPVMNIYSELSCGYDLSERAINYIVNNK